MKISQMFGIGIVLLVLVFSATAQSNDKVMALSSPLTSEDVCGAPDLAEKVILDGQIKRRTFEENELTLSGLVLQQAKDKRTFINLDTEFLASAWATANSDVAEKLPVGRKVKLELIRCRRVLYLYKILPASK